jgi:hypothetical protein
MIAFPDKITEGRNHRRRRDGSRKGNFNRVTRKRQCQRDNTNVVLASFCGSFRLKGEPIKAGCLKPYLIFSSRNRLKRKVAVLVGSDFGNCFVYTRNAESDYGIWYACLSHIRHPACDVNIGETQTIFLLAKSRDR